MSAMTTRPEPEVRAVAKYDPLLTDLGKIIVPFRAAVTPFLQHGITFERVVTELVLASRKTPGLENCQAEVLVDVICKALNTGGVIGTDVYIVPFRDTKKGTTEPVLMVDYKYKAELVVAAGGCRSLSAEAVYSDDHFEIFLGSEPRVVHRPALSPRADRKMIGAYAVAQMGLRHAPKIKWMPLKEIEVIRARSREWKPDKVRDCPPWYACKTALHQLCKLLLKHPQFAELMAQFERQEAVEMEVEEAEVVATATMERPATVDEHGVDLTYTDDTPPAPTNDGTVRHTDTDLAWALAYPIPFGDLKGKPLGEASDNYLHAVKRWGLKQLDTPNGFRGAQELCDAVKIAIEFRESEAEKERAAISESAAEFGAGNLGPILPGEVEGARAASGELPLGDTRKRPQPRNAIAEGR